MAVRRRSVVYEQNNQIGKRLDRRCVQKGWSYYKLADFSGIPLSTIQHIMDGTTKNPGIFTLICLCESLDITLESLLDQPEEIGGR